MFAFSNARSDYLWYLVGLITSDGCLSKDGRHITLISKDPLFLEQLRQAFRLTCRIGRHNGATGSLCFHLPVSSKNLYGFLLDVGLTPAKSLTLSALDVPTQQFPDFLRGMIDGDGCIRTWIHPSNGLRQWALEISSASPVFSLWLKESVEGFFGVGGRRHVRSKKRKNPIYTIKFGKLAAQVILRGCYYPECLALPRKFEMAWQCINTPNRVGKYGNVIAGVAKPANAPGLKPGGRKRP